MIWRLLDAILTPEIPESRFSREKLQFKFLVQTKVLSDQISVKQVLKIFTWTICLTDLSSDKFDFSSKKRLTSSAKWVLNSIRVYRLTFFPSMRIVLQKLFNCSQTKFVAIILVVSVVFKCDFFAWPIFRPTLLAFRPPTTGWTGSAQRALRALRAFHLCFSSNCFVGLTYGVKGGP